MQNLNAEFSDDEIRVLAAWVRRSFKDAAKAYNTREPETAWILEALTKLDAALAAATVN